MNKILIPVVPAEPGPEGDPSVFELIYRDIETYGKLFGTQDTVARSVADLRNRVAALAVRKYAAAAINHARRVMAYCLQVY